MREPEEMVFRAMVSHPKCMPTWGELDSHTPELGQDELDEAISAHHRAGIMRPGATTTPDGELVSLCGLTEFGVDQAYERFDVTSVRKAYEYPDRGGRGKLLAELPRPPMKEYRGLYVAESYDPD